MNTPDFASTRFSFKRRPTPVPGDMRIAWRVSLILLMLSASRSSKASLAKLHILNDAIRSNQVARLKDATAAGAKILPWNLRVEPAFARAIDLTSGNGATFKLRRPSQLMRTRNYRSNEKVGPKRTS